MQVNGRNLFLRGVRWDNSASSISPANLAVDAQLMHDAGINAVLPLKTIVDPDVMDVFHDHGIWVVNPIDTGSLIQSTGNTTSEHDAERYSIAVVGSNLEALLGPVINHSAILMWMIGKQRDLYILTVFLYFD